MSMFRRLIIGQYIDGSSIVHRLDPRTKIVTVFVWMISILLLQHIISFILALMVIFIIILMTKIPMKYIIRGLLPIWIIILITFAFHLFWNQGDDGIIKAIGISLRIICLVIVASLLTLTTKSSHLTEGLETLLSPLRRLGLPTQQFALMISITLRFIPLLLQETERIMKAQRSRGAQFTKGHIFKRMYQFISIIIPLIILAFQKAENITLAIEARGYHPGMTRSQLYSLHYRKIDYIALAVSLTLLLFMVITRIM